MIYAAIILIPLFFIFNGYGISVLFKKWKIFLNKYFLLLTGIFTVFAIFQIVFTFVYVFNADISSYLYVILVVQIILLIIFGLNWRYFLFCEKEWKSLIFFFVSWLVSILFIYIYNEVFRWANVEKEISLFEYLKNSTANIHQKIYLTKLIDFSVINIFTEISKNLFKINNNIDAIIFLKWGWTILFTFCVSLFLSSVFYRSKLSWWNNYSFLLIIEILLLFFSFFTYDSTAIGETWLCIIFSYFMYSIIAGRRFDNKIYLMIICLALFSFTSFVQNGVVFSLFLSLFVLWLCWKNNIAALFVFFNLLLINIFQIVNMYNILQAQIWWITFYVIYVLFVIWYITRYTWGYNYLLVSKISKGLNEGSKLIFFAIGMLIYLISLYWIVNNSKSIDFYIYNFDNIWSFDLSDSSIMYANIFLWLIYTASIIGWLLYMLISKKKQNYGYLFSYYLFVAIFFINPIPMRMYRIFLPSDLLNMFSLLNLIYFIPLLLAINFLNREHHINKRHKKNIIINNINE